MSTPTQLTSHFILFEKPLNETMRLLLRLDTLFTRYQLLRETNSATSFEEQLSIILRLLALTDRGDLKSKLTQLVHLLIQRLQRWQQHKEANQAPIIEALESCQKFLAYLHQTRDKLGHHLREHYFIKQLLAQHSHPGGLMPFSLPIYELWQHQVTEQRSHDINDWMREFDLLKGCVQLLLQFIRHNCDCQTVWVEQGFYQQPIDTKKSIQLFQVHIPTALNIFPNISVGRHHVSIHFHHVPQAGFDLAQAYQEPFECKLCFCDL